MRKKFKLCLFPVLFFSLMVFGQGLFAQTGTVKGTVKDVAGAPLSGASVTVSGRNQGTTSNAEGAFTLTLAAGSYKLTISFVGQTPQTVDVVVKANETVQTDIALTQLADLGGVLVVGTRSRLQRSQLSTPVPVDIINTREIKAFPQTDLTQLLTYVAPSFQSARQTVTDGTDHIDPAGLRGLGPDQTLVLVNGKRRHNTALVNINGSVGRGSVGTDLNAIPTAAIERIEVLRDGAAAQYGTDAIAGVINVVLKKNFKGLNISAMTGQNMTRMPYDGQKIKINDGQTYQVDFSGGLSGKKGAYINLSGQVTGRDRSNRSGNDNIPLIYYGNGGAFPTGPTGVSASDYRKYLIGLDATQVAARGYDRHNIVAGNSKMDNVGAFVNAGLPLGAKSSLYLSAGGSHRNGASAGFSRNPNSMAQQPVVANGSRYYQDGFLPEIHTKIDDISLITGFKASFGEWDFDLSNTVGQNTIKYNIQNTGNASLAPTANVQTQFDAGKLTFLQNTINADISRGFTFENKNSLNVAAGAEYRYENFKIGQGELNSYANGGRVASFDSIPNPASVGGFTKIANTPAGAGAQVFPGFQPTDAVNASRSIYAAYLDLEYNIGKVLIGAAGRYESYQEQGFSNSGTGFKLTAKYDISPNIGIRGSVNTGFRAPSLHQRYFQNTSTQFVNGLPSQSLTANNFNPIVRSSTGFGIDELKPEKSVSYTAGIVGKAGNGFTFTVDGYFIHIDDRIVLSTAFNRTNPVVVPIFTAYGVDASVNALQFWTNAINTETRGIDVVLSKRLQLGPGTANISLATNFNKTSVVGGINTNSAIDAAVNNPSLTDKSKNPANDLSNVLFDRQQRARVEAGQPQSKINLTLAYSLSHFDFLLRGVRFGETKFLNNVDPYATDATGAYWNDVGLGTDQTFKAKISTDLVITYKFIKGASIAVGANNLFDVYPDRIYVDPRNLAANVLANPVAGANKAAGGYGAGRDGSNRGRFLFTTSQFGFNGRFLFARLNVDIGQLTAKK